MQIDVSIKNDKISLIKRLNRTREKRVIGADNLPVNNGFVI